MGLSLCFLAVGARASAGDREAALAVIDRAIKAQGGEQALTRRRLVMRRGAGTMIVFDKDVPFTDETLIHLPEQFRLAANLGAGQPEDARSSWW